MKKPLLLPAIALYILLCACGIPKMFEQEKKNREQELTEIRNEIRAELQNEKQGHTGDQTVKANESITVEHDNPVNDDGIRPELKQLLDSYEEFIDEYVNFMNSYYKDPTNLELLSKYSDIMNKYAYFVSSIDNLDTSDMTNDECAYYINITSRVSQKMILALS